MRIKNTVARGSRQAIRRRAIVAVAAGMFAFGTATPALATTEYPEGGVWTYGVTGIPGVGTNYSNYFHPNSWHGSSVSNGNGLVRSACTSPGATSYASQRRTVSGNKAYYRFC